MAVDVGTVVSLPGNATDCFALAWTGVKVSLVLPEKTPHINHLLTV